MGEKELKILLDESRREYDRVMDLMIHNSSRILNLTALIPILVGIVVTSSVYVFTNLENSQSNELFFSPIAISLITLIIAFSLGLIGLLPIRGGNFYVPSKLYELKSDKEEKILDKLIQNYLISINKLIPKLEKRPFISALIIVMVVFSLIEYILFGIYHFIKYTPDWFVFVPYIVLFIYIIFIGYVLYMNGKINLKTTRVFEEE